MRRLRHITTDQTVPHIAHVITQFYIMGEIGHGEWLARLREIGLNVSEGFTRLTPEQMDKRNRILTQKYPRVGGTVATKGCK